MGGPQFLEKNTLQIFATDIDNDAIRAARRGSYASAILDGMPSRIVETYFQRTDAGYSVIPALKEVTLFSRHNVCQDPPFLNIDLVSCRNVLIYFNQSLQSRVLSRLHYALTPNGILFLGNSESVSGTDELFSSVAANAKLFKKRSYAQSSPNSTKPLHMMPRQPNRERTTKLKDRESRNLAQLQAKFEALSRAIAPKSLLVSSDMRILSVFGDVSGYLELAENNSPQLSLSLLKRPLAQEARTLLTLALRNNAKRSGRVWPLEDDPTQRFQLTAYPMSTSDDNDDVVALIGFSEWLELENQELPPSNLPEEATRQIDELQREVTATREALSQSVEQLETTNEELQLLNEELQSANEELQSTNEELETSNEELQSTNEELVTVNQEQMEISRELSTITEELGSVLTNIGVPVIVVNIALQVIRASEVAKEIFNMTSLHDEPHVSQFKMPIGCPNLTDTFHKVLTEGRGMELSMDLPGRDISIRFAPFFDSRGRLTGATAVFVGHDFTDLAGNSSSIVKNP